MRACLARSPLLLVTALACGCALTAKKVPTPAADLTAADLARLPREPAERYFLVLFGSQNLLRQPQYTHTSAALVRVRAADAGPGGTVTPGCVDPALDVQTISWLPVAGKIDALSRAVEPGRNFGLHETLKLAADTNQSIAVWGPYEVWHGFAHRFRAQKAFLDSGAVGYQCVDTWAEAAERGNGCNCIHAITDMDPVYPRSGYPLLLYGKPATGRVVRRIMHSPIFIDPRTTHDWLLPRLGLGAYPLERRRYVGLSEEHDPESPADLDVRNPVLPVTPLPKEAPKDPEPKNPAALPEPAPLPKNGPLFLPQRSPRGP